MNLLREGAAKVMFASEKGINNFTESQTIQPHEELQKHIKELLRKEQLIPYENKIKSSQTPQVSLMSNGAQPDSSDILKNPIVYITE